MQTDNVWGAIIAVCVVVKVVVDAWMAQNTTKAVVDNTKAVVEAGDKTADKVTDNTTAIVLTGTKAAAQVAEVKSDLISSSQEIAVRVSEVKSALVEVSESTQHKIETAVMEHCLGCPAFMASANGQAVELSRKNAAAARGAATKEQARLRAVIDAAAAEKK